MGFLRQGKHVKGAEMKRLRRILKPSLWQRFKTWAGTARPEEEARVNAYKVVFRGIRGKSVASNEAKIRSALSFIGSKHVAHSDRAAIVKHLLKGSGLAHHESDLVSSMKKLYFAGDHEKLQSFFSSGHLVAAVKEAAEKRRFLPRRTFTLLTSNKQLTRDVLARGLIAAAQEHKLGTFSPEVQEEKDLAKKMQKLIEQKKKLEQDNAAFREHFAQQQAA